MGGGDPQLHADALERLAADVLLPPGQAAATEAAATRHEARAHLTRGGTVDAARWWATVQRESAVASEQPAAELWPAERLARALRAILRALARANARRGELERLGGAGIDGAVAFAGGELLLRWWREAERAMAAPVVNELLQHAGCGVALPACHTHRLIESRSARAAGPGKAWLCSACAHQVSDDGEGTAFRCAPCGVNVCRPCAIRAFRSSQAPAPQPPVRGGKPRDAKPPAARDARRQDCGRFFSLSLSRLAALLPREAFADAARALADELHNRMNDVVPTQSRDLAAMLGVLRDLCACQAFAPAVLAATPAASRLSPSTQFSQVQWIPRFMHTHMMAQHSLLGAALRATFTPTDFPSDHAVRPEQRRGWRAGYAGYKAQLSALFRALLDPERQHPRTVDATLAWLSVTVHSTNRRRQSSAAHGGAPATSQQLDGFLINLSATLVSLVLPALKRALRTDASAIDAMGHQSFVAVRGFGDKDHPEVPLRDLQADEDLAAAARDARRRSRAKILALDREGIRRHRAALEREARACGEAEEAGADAHDDGEHFYPVWRTHERVQCDICERENFDCARYKCVFCDNFDICEDCFERFAQQSAAAAEQKRRGLAANSPLAGAHPLGQSLALEPDASWEYGLGGDELDAPVHDVDHAFFRVSTPIPTYSANHFEFVDLSLVDLSLQASGGSHGAAKPLREVCADCARPLESDERVYKCANCLEPRVVCAECLHAEERRRDPLRMHSPGHLYLVLLRPWRRRFDANADALLFPSLLHPPGLLPRLRFGTDTELFYVALRCLHFGPLLTLATATRMLQEMRELSAFARCEEEQLQHERRQALIPAGPVKMSTHYTASKSRLNILSSAVEAMGLQLLEPAAVAGWLAFFGRASRWLLRLAPPEQDAFQEPLTRGSLALSAFPEFFLADLCDAVGVLGAGVTDFDAVTSSLASDHGADESERADLLEALFVLLLQAATSLDFASNGALRQRAFAAFAALLAWLKDERAAMVRSVFERCAFLRTTAAARVLAFHADVERALAAQRDAMGGHAPPSTAPAGGDAALWQFLPTRAAVATALRFFWQLDGPRRALRAELQAPTASDLPARLALLVSGMWGDLAKLVDDASGTIATLRHLLGVADSAGTSALPFRPELLDGHRALHARQLRLAMRVMFELVDALAALAGTSALRAFVLDAALVDQAARVSNLLLGWLHAGLATNGWGFSARLAADARLLLAAVVALVVCCAGLHGPCSPSAMRSLREAGGRCVLARVGDLDARVRWNASLVAAQLAEARRRHDREDDDGLADDAADASTPRALGKRFMAALARDGRFDADKFAALGELLRREEPFDRASYELLDRSWARAFRDVLSRARALMALQRELDARLADAPAEFLDPLLATLMADPVRLPSSGAVVDRAVIERHLVSPLGATDPFSRAPLSPAMLQPCAALKRQIRAFLRARVRSLSPPVDMEDALVVLGMDADGGDDQDDAQDDGQAPRRGVKRARDSGT